MEKKELKLLIAKNETEKVIEYLLLNLKNSNKEKYNEIVLISLNHTSLKTKIRIDVLTHQESNIENNKINQSLLNFIDTKELKEESNIIINYPPPKLKEYVNYNKEMNKICENLEKNFCVLVEGISGSGKTFMVSNL